MLSPVLDLALNYEDEDEEQQQQREEQQVEDFPVPFYAQAAKVWA